jgi:hypothetical protein
MPSASHQSKVLCLPRCQIKSLELFEPNVRPSCSVAAARHPNETEILCVSRLSPRRANLKFLPGIITSLGDMLTPTGKNIVSSEAGQTTQTRDSTIVDQG